MGALAFDYGLVQFILAVWEELLVWVGRVAVLFKLVLYLGHITAINFCHFWWLKKHAGVIWEKIRSDFICILSEAIWLDFSFLDYSPVDFSGIFWYILYNLLFICLPMGLACLYSWFDQFMISGAHSAIFLIEIWDSGRHHDFNVVWSWLKGQACRLDHLLIVEVRCCNFIVPVRHVSLRGIILLVCTAIALV